jgi:GxxExxY protein
LGGAIGIYLQVDRQLLAKGTNTEDTATDDGVRRLVHGKTSNSIISAAYRVHGKLGPGLLERPYHACLKYELERMNLMVESEKILPVVYDDFTIDTGYRIDLLVDDVVIVEIKSVESLLPVHEAQLLTYLKLARKRVGLLINFNVAMLRQGIRRLIYGFEEQS